jgi:hypothetical protein
MNARHLVGLCGALALLAACRPVAPMTEQSAAMTLEQQKVHNAMSAGLPAIANDATVMDGGNELGKGSNGWTCVTDDPMSPLDDPMCFNASWGQLIGTEPNAEREAQKLFGLNYMLKGGAVADNANPAATEPPEGMDWVIDAPHVMLVSSSDLDPATYPTDHHWGGPYIMFEGTPAEHLMIPITGEGLPSADDPIQNAMSAAPLRVAENAAILGVTAEGQLEEVRPGTNGWTCLPDDPTTPTNDPLCGDAQWLEWIDAFFTGREPDITAVGVAYMLQGGSGASASDPTLTAPPEGQGWMVDGPHIMVVAPWDLDPDVYSTDPMSGEPYIMFAGTPYEHLMVPVTEMPVAEMRY